MLVSGAGARIALLIGVLRRVHGPLRAQVLALRVLTHARWLDLQRRVRLVAHLIERLVLGDARLRLLLGAAVAIVAQILLFFDEVQVFFLVEFRCVILALGRDVEAL